MANATRANRLADFARKHLDRFEKNLDAALDQGGVEAVHDLRVASRRVDQPLRLMRDWLSGKQFRRARARLKQTRQAFADVRDLDVLTLSFEDNGVAADLSPDALTWLFDELNRRRERGLADAVRFCERKSAWNTVKTVAALCESFESSADDDGAQVANRLEKQFARHADRLARTVTAVLAGGAEHDLHEVRIRAKKLRYTSELRNHVAARDNDPLPAALKGMQDVLGHWNDQIVAANRIARLANERDIASHQTQRASCLLAHAATRLRRAAEITEGLHAAWSCVEAVLAGPSAAPFTVDNGVSSTAGQEDPPIDAPERTADATA